MWLITLAYALPVGPFNVWYTVLNDILKPLKVDQVSLFFLSNLKTFIGSSAQNMTKIIQMFCSLPQPGSDSLQQWQELSQGCLYPYLLTYSANT